jgi:hypothetical protein
MNGPHGLASSSPRIAVRYRAETFLSRHQHYAFVVTEDEFNEIFARIKAVRQDYWSDPIVWFNLTLTLHFSQSRLAGNQSTGSPVGE